MAKTLTGGCACGAVRYEISGEAKTSAQCQCRDCQRATGTGHVDSMTFPTSAVKLTGELKFHDSPSDSGNTMSRGFCPNCGSPVMWTLSRNPDVRVIMVGSLDDPSVFTPGVVFYTSSGHAWDQLDPALPKYERLPPPRPS